VIVLHANRILFSISGDLAYYNRSFALGYILDRGISTVHISTFADTSVYELPVSRAGNGVICGYFGDMEHVQEISVALFVLELTGVIAFAVAGALTAIERELDIFGVLVLATITALGGGIIRDVLVGRFPVSLQNPVYFYVALLGALLAIPALRLTPKSLLWLKLFDALGLALFSVLGAQVGLLYHLNFLSTLLLGLLTGIGGGVLQDMLANEIPLVLRQEVYALASVIGISVLWVIVHAGGSALVAVIAGAVIILGIRIAAIYWNLNLPRIRRP
jgi:uncharacterized membrane protein YeiH